MTHQANQRAFTLIELMTVVVIIGVLAVLGVVGYRRVITSAKTAEATSVVQAIRVAQEDFHSETGRYANIGITPICPRPVETTLKKVGWNPACVGSAGNPWSLLAVHVEGGVSYSYGVTAGLAGDDVVAAVGQVNGHDVVWPKPTKDWFVVQAQGDMDGNGVPSKVIGASMMNELLIDQEGE